jgi:hypothetical protein
MKFILEAEDIELKNGWYIKADSIAWHVVKIAQVMLLFLVMAMPYLLAMVIAECLGVF